MIGEVIADINRYRLWSRRAIAEFSRDIERSIGRDDGSDSLEDVLDDVDLVTFDSLSESSEGRKSRGSMRLIYLRSCRRIGQNTDMTYAEYFEGCARRAISMWNLSEGVFRLTTGPDTPKCYGAPSRYFPIVGTLRSVLSLLFAMKMDIQSDHYGLHDATERAIRSNLSDWNFEDDRYIESAPTIYYDSTLFVTRDKARFEAIAEIACSTGGIGH